MVLIGANNVLENDLKTMELVISTYNRNKNKGENFRLAQNHML